MTLWRMGVLGWFHEARMTYKTMSTMTKVAPFHKEFPEHHLLAKGVEPKVTLFEALGAVR